MTLTLSTSKLRKLVFHFRTATATASFRWDMEMIISWSLSFSHSEKEPPFRRSISVIRIGKPIPATYRFDYRLLGKTPGKILQAASRGRNVFKNGDFFSERIRAHFSCFRENPEPFQLLQQCQYFSFILQMLLLVCR